jgi:hypothetical protein
MAPRPRTTSKRKPIQIEFEGTTDTLGGWSRRLGIPSGTLFQRYHRGLRAEALFHRGRLDARCLTRPRDGRMQSVSAWAREMGIKYNTLRIRLRRWPERG